jgi:hypothetical protein
MANLGIVSRFEIEINGTTFAANQGESDSSPDELYSFSESPTVTGLVYPFVGQVPTATVRTLWDEDSNYPVDFDYLYCWADQIIYLQLIGQTGNVTHKIRPYFPFWLCGYGSILPAANTTLITGGSEPTMEAVDSIAIGNYSGSTVNVKLFLID